MAKDADSGKREVEFTFMKDVSVVIFESLQGAVAAFRGINGKRVQESGELIESEFLDVDYVRGGGGGEWERTLGVVMIIKWKRLL